MPIPVGLQQLPQGVRGVSGINLSHPLAIGMVNAYCGDNLGDYNGFRDLMGRDNLVPVTTNQIISETAGGTGVQFNGSTHMQQSTGVKDLTNGVTIVMRWKTNVVKVNGVLVSISDVGNTNQVLFLKSSGTTGSQLDFGIKQPNAVNTMCSSVSTMVASRVMTVAATWNSTTKVAAIARNGVLIDYSAPGTDLPMTPGSGLNVGASPVSAVYQNADIVFLYYYERSFDNLALAALSARAGELLLVPSRNFTGFASASVTAVPTGRVSSVAFGVMKARLRGTAVSLGSTFSAGTSRGVVKGVLLGRSSTLGLGLPKVRLRGVAGGDSSTTSFGAAKGTIRSTPTSRLSSLQFGVPSSRLVARLSGRGSTASYGTIVFVGSGVATPELVAGVNVSIVRVGIGFSQYGATLFGAGRVGIVTGEN